jgi:aspartate kinase
MQELAEAGARVLNAQAVEFARRAGIVLHARATRGGEGTVVGPVPAEPRVSGVTGQTDLVLLHVRNGDRLEEVLEFLDAAGAPAMTVLGVRKGTSTSTSRSTSTALTPNTQHPTPNTDPAGFAALLLSLENIHGFPSLRADLEQRFGTDVACEEGLGAISAVGVGITADGELLRQALEALEGLGVPVAGIHTTSLRLTLLVPAGRVPDGVRRLHEVFLPGSGG